MANPSRHDFDRQAPSFDQRAGLPAGPCASIAQHIVRLANLASGDHLLLEIGAGTGQIGDAVRKHWVRYLGFDRSLPMLRVFAQRDRTAGSAPLIVAADANRHWPVRDRCVSAVFGSRSLHLLPPEHVVEEFFRVSAATGALLLIGHVAREQNSVRAKLRRRMRAILGAHGYETSEGRRADEQLLAACIMRRAATVPACIAAMWPRKESAADVLRSWGAKPLVGGIELPGNVKDRVLDELATWARGALGSLDAPYEATEQYIITGVQLPPL